MSGIDFGDNNASRYYTISDSSALTLPDSDWAIGVRVRVQDNTGTNFQYILSTGPFASNLNLFLTEDSASADPGSWKVDIGNLNAVVIGPSVGADDEERIIVVQRKRGTLEFKSCVNNGTIASWGTDTISGSDDGGDWYYGARVDLDTDRFYEEHAGQLFFLSASLTDKQIESLAALQGLSDVGVSSTDIVFDLQPTGPTESIKDESGKGRGATQHGTGWPEASTFALNPISTVTTRTRVPGRLKTGLLGWI